MESTHTDQPPNANVNNSCASVFFLNTPWVLFFFFAWKIYYILANLLFPRQVVFCFESSFFVKGCHSIILLRLQHTRSSRHRPNLLSNKREHIICLNSNTRSNNGTNTSICLPNCTATFFTSIISNNSNISNSSNSSIISNSSSMIKITNLMFKITKASLRIKNNIIHSNSNSSSSSSSNSNNNHNNLLKKTKTRKRAHCP